MRKIIFILLFLPIVSRSQTIPLEWLTKAEKTQFRETSRYFETLEFIHKLEKHSEYVKIISIGQSGEGRDIPLIIISKDKLFKPLAAFNSDKVVVLIQNCIHSGEVEGKDASLMLIRDILIAERYNGLLDNIILLILPIYNPDGHERFGPFNRINQNGPDEMGWRTNATNLNLNRDYIKADAPETKAFLKLFNTWKPDLFIDIHTTNGADYQYAVTYAIDNNINVAPVVRNWVNTNFLGNILPKMEKIGYPLAPYVWFLDNKIPAKGMYGGIAPPRLANSFVTLHNRPGLLIETHMLKDYKTRVEATYYFLQTIFENLNSDPKSIKQAVREADEQTVKGFGNNFPLTFESTGVPDTIDFLSFESKIDSSAISGSEWIQWTDKPINIKVPWFRNVKIVKSINPPIAYLIPKQWKEVTELLLLHGLDIEVLSTPMELEVEKVRFVNPKWQERPYEGRLPVTYSVENFIEKQLFPEGTIVVYLNQRTAKVAIHLLEPEGPDALVAWGFFNPIFEQKEYVENYVAEKLARDMLAADESLKIEFEEKLKSDTTFAKNPVARLNFFYQRSPYRDKNMNVYPITRLRTDTKINTIPYKFQK